MFLGLSTSALGQGAEEEPSNPEEEIFLFREDGGDNLLGADDVPTGALTFFDFLRVFSVLLALIALVYFILLILKKFTPLKELGEGQIQILSSRQLRGDGSLHLIEVGNQVFLVGAGSSSVNLISEITDQESLDKIRLEAGAAQSAGKTFRDLIRTGLSLGKAPPLSSVTPATLKGQRQRLQNLRKEEE